MLAALPHACARLPTPLPEFVAPLKEGIERGMREGWLHIPEGLPMLW